MQINNKLKLVTPSFDSEITDLIIELNYLRRQKIIGTTHPIIFKQLKKIFHMLESVGSGRIEGNRTTIVEYIEYKADNKIKDNEEIIEISNIENALEFIDENIHYSSINRFFLDELHKIVVRNLNKEGSKAPGEYRKSNLIINGSKHVPPDFTQVDNYMRELIEFINNDDPTKYDLLKTAIAHHRFVWIHPYDNGNGRTVRLLTYAMLVKQGFNIQSNERIINPTAVFCFDRNRYYDYLSKADENKEDGILEWCHYVLKGLKYEIEKIDNLLDYDYVKNQVLLPSIKFCLDRKLITPKEEKILIVAIKKVVFQNSDLSEIFKDKKISQISREIRNLKNRNLIQNEENSSRKYIINFSNSYLLRGVIKCLEDKGFIQNL